MTATQKKPRWLRIFLNTLRSSKLFWIFFGIFLFEALWIAFSGAYSMAYDEYFHFGLIKLHTDHWLPFFTQQPAGAEVYGAVVRDPSYLYHYVMSLPLSLFGHFVHSQVAQIIFLRLIDIGFFAAGLLVFRKVFRLARVTPLVSNLVLVFLMLLPVASFMAAQINYDNLLFLLTGVSVYLAIQVVDEIRDGARLPLLRLFALFSVGMLASLVKYAYLPILLGVTLYVLLSFVREVRLKEMRFGHLLLSSLPRLKTWRGVLIAIIFVLSFGLFMERYAVNTWRYHTPVVSCDQVLTVQSCRAYDPFGRNQSFKEQNLKSIVSERDKNMYLFSWLHSMLRSAFFSVGPRQLDYPPGQPLALGYAAGYIVGIGGIILVAWRARRLWLANHAHQLFFLMIAVYCLALFFQNYKDFRDLGVAVAINARYLVVVAPLGLLLVAESARELMVRWPRKIGALTVSALLALMIAGGGFLPFIIRSSDAWLWDNPTVLSMNHAVRNTLWRITIH